MLSDYLWFGLTAWTFHQFGMGWAMVHFFVSILVMGKLYTRVRGVST
mgnify:FL=1